MEQIITFNGLGLSFYISKIAFSIGSIQIRWYAIIMVVAFTFGIIYAVKYGKDINLKWDDVFIVTSIIVILSYTGARAYYVLFNIDKYIDSPLKIFRIQDGGLAIYGGIIGAIFALFIYCKFTKRNLLQLMDFVCPILPLGQAIGRWGNFINREAHGTETTNILRMGIYEKGQYLEVHPTFLYESIVCFIIFILLHFIRNKRSFEGESCAIYLIFYGIGRSFIEGLRTDSLMLGSIRISQLVSLVLVIVGVIIILVNKNMKKNKMIMYIIPFLIVFIDQIIKFIMINKNIIVIPNFFSIKYSENTGGAYSIFSNNFILILGLSIIIIALLFKFYKEQTQIKKIVPLSFILGGAIGNLIDRIFRGYIIDYIKIDFFDFPIFNIADMFIVVGIIFFAVYIIIKILQK